MCCGAQRHFSESPPSAKHASCRAAVSTPAMELRCLGCELCAWRIKGALEGGTRQVFLE